MTNKGDLRGGVEARPRPKDEESGCKSVVKAMARPAPQQFLMWATYNDCNFTCRYCPIPEDCCGRSRRLSNASMTSDITTRL